MRRKDKEITDPALIETILSTSQLCRLAMIDEKGEPYIVPLNYGYSGGALYFHSAGTGRKIDILKTSNRVCFEIEHGVKTLPNEIPCKWSAKYRSIIGYGAVELITDEESKLHGLDIIMAQHGEKGHGPYVRNQVRSIVVLKLTIERMTAKQSGDWNE